MKKKIILTIAFLNSKRIKISTFVMRRDIHGKYLL